jgi:FlaA1/EpsC-like NDP-sugar epimerase
LDILVSYIFLISYRHQHQHNHAIMRFTMTDFVRSQWKILPPNPDVDLTGQTVLVTGSNTGIGLEAAKVFATMNPAHLVLAVRSIAKGQEALAGKLSILTIGASHSMDIHISS